MLANKSITPQTVPPEEYETKRRYFAANAIGGYPFVGTPDRVAEELAVISQAGVRGIGVVVRQLSQRGAVFLRRGVAASGTRGRTGEALRRPR